MVETGIVLVLIGILFIMWKLESLMDNVFILSKKIDDLGCCGECPMDDEGE